MKMMEPGVLSFTPTAIRVIGMAATARAVVPVKVVVSVRERYDDLHQILQTQVVLKRHNQEETAFRFQLTGQGELVPGSVTTLRHRLVTAPGGWKF